MSIGKPKDIQKLSIRQLNELDDSELKSTLNAISLSYPGYIKELIENDKPGYDKIIKRINDYTYKQRQSQLRQPQYKGERSFIEKINTNVGTIITGVKPVVTTSKEFLGVGEKIQKLTHEHQKTKIIKQAAKNRSNLAEEKLNMIKQKNKNTEELHQKELKFKQAEIEKKIAEGEMTRKKGDSEISKLTKEQRRIMSELKQKQEIAKNNVEKTQKQHNDLSIKTENIDNTLKKTKFAKQVLSKKEKVKKYLSGILTYGGIIGAFAVLIILILLAIIFGTVWAIIIILTINPHIQGIRKYFLALIGGSFGWMYVGYAFVRYGYDEIKLL